MKIWSFAMSSVRFPTVGLQLSKPCVKYKGPIEVNPTKSGGACLPMQTTHPNLPPLIYFIKEALLKQVCQHCNIHKEKLFNASND